MDAAVARVERECPWPEGQGEHAVVACSGAQRARLRVIGRWLTRLVPPPARVVDIGTGQALLPAALASMGYDATGVDDWSDPWHSAEAERIARDWAARMRFRLVLTAAQEYGPSTPVDAVTLVDVVEHLHDGPRELLNHVGSILRPGGLVISVMPNSVNLRKRASVLVGRTNYPPLRDFFLAPAPWRGHVREYTSAESGEMLRLAGFEVVANELFDSILFDKVRSRIAREALGLLTAAIPTTKDSLLSIGRKPTGWTPIPSAERVNWRPEGANGSAGSRTSATTLQANDVAGVET